MNDSRDVSTLTPLSQAIEAGMDRWAVPGLAVGIYREGQAETLAFGVKDIDGGEPVTRDTVFGIGSISKVFTATLAVSLADAGKVSLDEPIDSILPVASVPASLHSEGVTLRHLLTHTSGLEGDGFADHGDDDDALGRYIRSLNDAKQICPPGKAWSYANTGFCLAGHVLEVALGTPFETLVADNMLKPLQLEDTGFGQSPASPNAATGYDHGPGEDARPRAAGTTWRSANPAGGMTSTVPDLLRFARFHMGEFIPGGTRVVDPGSLERMRQVQVRLTSVDGWGVGWGIRTCGTTELVEHGGWMDGYRAQVTMIPGMNSAIAILNNGGYGHALNDEIRDGILKHVFGLEENEASRIAVPESTLQSYVGRYRSSHVDVEFQAVDGRLQGRYRTAWHDNNGDDMGLDPVGNAEFVIRGGEFNGDRVTFLPDLKHGQMAVRFLSRVMFRDLANTDLPSVVGIALPQH